jgi:dihydroorotate dehydrogenase (NAD+) catalytic subunit
MRSSLLWPAVSVGTANFFNPYATVEIAEGIEKFMVQQKVEDISQIIGIVK